MLQPAVVWTHFVELCVAYRIHTIFYTALCIAVSDRWCHSVACENHFRTVTCTLLQVCKCHQQYQSIYNQQVNQVATWGEAGVLTQSLIGSLTITHFLDRNWTSVSFDSGVQNLFSYLLELNYNTGTPSTHSLCHLLSAVGFVSPSSVWHHICVLILNTGWDILACFHP